VNLRKDHYRLIVFESVSLTALPLKH